MNIEDRNILEIESGIIGHQVNCHGVMNAGLAKKIRELYPEVYYAYRAWLSEPTRSLGKIQLVKIASKQKLYVANMAGQYGYGRTQTHTDYNALGCCLQELQGQSEALQLDIYLPFKLGCGLAGGDWDTVKTLIDRYCPSATICKYNV
jgi:O-acetyl-ADP-ribose deacetylase (regulator of RNase III)